MYGLPELGSPENNEPTVQLNVRVPQTFLRQLRALAAREDRTQAAIVRRVLRTGLEAAIAEGSSDVR